MQRKHHAASGQGGENGSIFAARAFPISINALARKRCRGLTSALTAASFLAMAASGALADDAAGQGRSAAQPTNEQLIEKLERMEARIRSLESELHRKGEANAKHGSKARAAATRGKAANGTAEASTAAGAPESQQSATVEPPPPAKRTPGASHLHEAPGFLGRRETTFLEAPRPADTGLFGAAPSGAPEYQQSATVEPPPPGKRTPGEVSNLQEAPGFLGARYTAKLAAPALEQDLFGVAPSPVPGLVIGAYGEFAFGAQQNPAANGQWQTGFDTTRLVLTPSYLFNDNIIFNGEIEWEHGGIATDADDKLRGEINIEQAWVDFRIVPYFNIRAPGIDLVPIDWLNLYHEPTRYYSVLRPELNRGLIPSTWRAPAASIWGQLIEGVNYQFQVNSALEDFGGGPITDARTPLPFPIGYDPGITGIEAVRAARAPIGSFRQLSNYLGYIFRLSYAPTFLPGFDSGTSIYFTPSTTPRGAYSQLNGAPLGRSSLTIFETDFRYHVPDTGFEFRGEFADIIIGNPANLRVNNDLDPVNNVGKSLWGASGEVAYHIPLSPFFGPILGSNWEAVPFYRYTYQNFQTGGFGGTDLNFPVGFGRTQFHVAGIAVFPTPELVLKLNYLRSIDAAPRGISAHSVLGGLGFYF